MKRILLIFVISLACSGCFNSDMCELKNVHEMTDREFDFCKSILRKG